MTQQKTRPNFIEKEKRMLAINACKLDQSYRIVWQMFKHPEKDYFSHFSWSLQRCSFGKWISVGEYGGKERYGFTAMKSGVYPFGRI